MSIKYVMVASFSALALATVSCMAAKQNPIPVPWNTVKPISVENVGTKVGQVSIYASEQVKVPGRNEFQQLICYKMGGQKDTTFMASLHLPSGAVKPLGQVPGSALWRTTEAGSKLYIGMYPPGHFLEYDPATNTLTDLGKPFTKGSISYALHGSADGSVVIGAGGSTEVALFDPVTRKTRNYGEVGRSGAGYAYYVSHDANYLYAVPRGDCPWDLISIDRRTGKTATLITMPHEGYINLQGLSVTATKNVNKAGEPQQYYDLKDGRLVPTQGRTARGNRSGQGNPFLISFDKRPAATTGKVGVLFRPGKSPGGAGSDPPWLKAQIPVTMESMPVTRVAQVGPSQIAGTTGPYGPMFLFDVARNSTRILGPAAAMNAYSIANIGDKVYVSGYPSTAFAVLDLDRAFTAEDPSGEGPGTPWTDARANPRMIASLGQVLEGSHTGVGVFPGADGRIYICGQRHRHNKGFAVGWYDPRTDKVGEVSDGGILQQLQVSWVTAIEGGKKLAFSTRVQPDENKSAPPPSEARLLILDTATGRFAPPIVPLPGAQALGPITEVSGGALVGTASDPAKNEAGPSILYKFDLRSGKTVATKSYQGLICGVSGNHDAPSKSHDFMTGPDGKVWTVYRIPTADAPALLMRIRPADLGIELLGTLPGDGIRFLFMGPDLYLTGAQQLRRIRGATSGA